MAMDARPIFLDMVHNNPGEEPFVTRYNDPTVLRDLGCTGKVFELFEAAQFGVDWSATDPEVFPVGSKERAWVDAKAEELTRFYDATKAAGLQVFCHTDMVILPKRLVQLRGLKHPGDLSDPATVQAVRDLLAGIFARFPQVDGLVIRIGETYLQGAPYHMGAIDNKTDPQRTIIPLMNLLRDEVCVKRGKQVIFRSWYSFDVDLAKYRAVSDGVEPHPNLVIVVKHCEGDFHRGNPFSKVLGQGRHRQLVEIQCQREYEGKGAYPNYVMNGVIEGFEEHVGQPGASLTALWKNPLTAGVSTWSRGGGWRGPYLTNEFWCSVNMAVLAQWLRAPGQGEAAAFRTYAASLGLDEAGIADFRTLCLDSAAAILRGRRSTKPALVDTWWTRDQYIELPKVPQDPADRALVLSERDAAVTLWEGIVARADRLRFADPATTTYVRTSSRYGLHLYRIYQASWHLVAVGKDGDATERQRWIAAYDAAWKDLRTLKEEHPECATLYEAKGFTINGRGKPGIGAFVDTLRKP